MSHPQRIEEIKHPQIATHFDFVDKINELVRAWNSHNKGECKHEISPISYRGKYYCIKCGQMAVVEEVPQKTYARDYSHIHCWNQKTYIDTLPACGIPLEKHTQCCLCDTEKPHKLQVRSEEESKRKAYLPYSLTEVNVGEVTPTAEWEVELNQLLERLFMNGDDTNLKSFIREQITKAKEDSWPRPIIGPSCYKGKHDLCDSTACNCVCHPLNP